MPDLREKFDSSEPTEENESGLILEPALKMLV